MNFFVKYFSALKFHAAVKNLTVKNYFYLLEFFNQ